jgi:hypothetical protein
MFDAWFAGELPDELAPSMEKHVLTCQRCRGRRAALAVDRSAFLAVRPNYIATPSQVARKHRHTLVLGCIAGSIVLVALAVLAREPDLEDPPPAAAQNELGFAIERSDVTQPGVRGQEVRPGDRVRFEYSLEAPAYFAVYGLDARGSVRVYYPAAELSAPAGAGRRIPLGTTLEVAAVFGTEQVYALFCNAEFPVGDPQRTLELQRSLAPSPGCDVSVTEWTIVR